MKQNDKIKETSVMISVITHLTSTTLVTEINYDQIVILLKELGNHRK